MLQGIPDFRSKGGMYNTLQPDLLTASKHQKSLMRSDSTYVVEKSMFFSNQFPYLEVRRPFILGTAEKRWKATLSHRFAELLHTNTGKLTRVYTQNIDGLHEQCENIPREKIVAVHGTIGRASCEACGEEMDFKDFCKDVREKIKDIYNIDNTSPKESSFIHCKKCSKPTVKPTTVLFGGSLPEEFFIRADQDLPHLDLLIIAGTSLVVSPANSLVYNVPSHTIRIIINRDPVGEELGIEYSQPKRDFFAQGDCDDIFLELMCCLGWLDELIEIADHLPEQSANLIRSKMNDYL